ncbi:MAG: LacI family transcriptional regulator [Lachnospiraceae bacterium]|jgi:LacI family transcriptional regulator|nr:LacI family transcriptional regulator [Lachnospiraceae bacterium]
MSATIKDIARECGVGVSTVSRAINNHPDINQDTKKLVLDTVKKYNYVPNNSARNLKRIASKTIAILVKGISNPLFFSMVEMMEKEIKNNKYNYFLQHVDDRQDEVDIAISLIKEKRLSGIVFLGGLYDRSEEKLSKITVPFVLSTIGMMDANIKATCSSFSLDDKLEGYKIVDYLIKKGHKKIAFLGASADDESVGKLRLEGYKKAHKENNISFDEDLIRCMDETLPSYSMKNGYKVMKDLLANKKQFTAVFAISDMQAIGASKAIFEAGLKIPEDISMVGFDGLDNGLFYNPSITTLAQPIEEISTESISALFKMIKSKKSVKGKVFPGTLIERESTRAI